MPTEPFLWPPITASFNMELLVAGESLLLAVLLLIPCASIAIGVVAAVILRLTRPETYTRIGGPWTSTRRRITGLSR